MPWDADADDEFENLGLDEWSRSQVETIVDDAARKGRSACFLWFYDRFEQIRSGECDIPLTWQGRCEALTVRGVTGVRGKPLTPETTKKAWLDVLKLKGLAAGRAVDQSNLVLLLDQPNSDE